MPACFFDSSGIVKRYVNEIGTPWVLSLAAPGGGNRIHVARITGVEVVAAITRRQRSGSLTPSEAALVLDQFRHQLPTENGIVAITPALLTRAIGDHCREIAPFVPRPREPLRKETSADRSLAWAAGMGVGRWPRAEGYRAWRARPGRSVTGGIG